MKAMILISGLSLVVMSISPGSVVPQEFGGTNCVKKIKPKSCTSCTESYFDNECTTGRDFQDCSPGEIFCTNGARCDQDTGSGPCSP